MGFFFTYVATAQLFYVGENNPSGIRRVFCRHNRSWYHTCKGTTHNDMEAHANTPYNIRDCVEAPSCTLPVFGFVFLQSDAKGLHCV